MIIEIKGIGIPNKGAELMLVAVMEHFFDQDIDVKFVSEPYTDYYTRARYGLYQRASLSFKGRNFDWLWNLVPARLRKPYGIVLNKEIDVVLDASGFAYGDQWGLSKLKQRLTNQIKAYKKNGTKLILLPQALGSFKQVGFNEQLNKLADYAHLICVRDEESREYLIHAVGERNNVVKFPDFTGIVAPSTKSIHEQVDYGICIIPNAKMLEMRSDGDSYKKSMAALAKWAYDNDQRVTILVHEGQKDLALARYIRDQVANEIEILTASDPKEIKQIIKKSRIVVSSRFHGLVSALSQAVPAIATGWSHKYMELMRDYKIENLMVEDLSELTKKLEWLSAVDNYNSVKETLIKSSSLEKEKIQVMWKRIDELLGL